MEVNKTPILKDVYTNSLYQSTFLPIFERAETRIKELIFAAFLYGKSKYILLLAIAQIISDVDKKIPNTLYDKEQYMKALQVKSQFMVRNYYDRPQAAFNEVKEKLMGSIPVGKKAPVIKNPKEALDLIQSKDLWAEAKGYPNVVNYPKEVKVRLHQLAQEPITTQEPGKKPISLWQKAELDVRYENQMQNLQNMRVEGVKYAWLSSHPNASKRCAQWQGSLVSLEGHAVSPQTVVNHKTFRYNKSTYLVGKIDGKNVYSLTDIMATVDDKYGYHNNIICGFNCRHRLIPYTPGSAAPREFNEKELNQQREIESKIRDMERTIRLKKKDLALNKIIGNAKTVSDLTKEIKKLTNHYMDFCNKNGYAFYKYRITV